MELLVPLSLNECQLALEEFQYLGDQQGGLLGKLTSRKRSRYVYSKTLPVDAPCFKRPNVEKLVFNKKSEIIPLPLPRPTGWLSVVFPENAQPKLAAKDQVIVGTLTDGRVDIAMFKFEKSTADTVLSSLKTKYGKNPKITPMKWQNSTGAVVEYYLARWDFPTFYVEMQSAGLNFWIDMLTDYDAITLPVWSQSNNPFSSPYGVVKITNKSREEIENKGQKGKVDL